MDDSQDHWNYMIPTELTELIPIFGGVVTIVAVSLKIGRLLQKIDNAIEDMEDIKKDINQIKSQLNEVEKRLIILEK
ncbi:MAG: hypothetical protein PHH85_08210 [Candidatus Methanoperedens sp.]|nr:hypothetical protein [Candidatus Methanoperedens sp.]MDD5616170.1 hypothetical protein [Candidatus Methanoperedens sp.]